MASEIKIGSTLFDSEYIVDKKIATGGEGTTYVVHSVDAPRKKLCAKVFTKPEKVDEDFWIKRSNEARTSLRISQRPNPNLMTTHKVWVTDDDQVVLIMDYIEGQSLIDYLNKHGCLTPKVALNIFKKLLNGIKQLHSYKQKIIHRDLKPENIMVSNDLSQVVIIDFGISSVITDEAHKILTKEPQLFGTASYILPDLLDDALKNDKLTNISVQSDFFSLGVILYVMIMGTLPFTPINAVDKNGVPDNKPTIRLPQRFDMINISANPTIPTSLENIIYRCIVSNPREIKHRYNNVDEIIEDVNKCLLIIDKKSDPTPLIKPVALRWYQQEKQFDIEQIKSDQKWYKQWWFFALIVGIALTIIIVAIFSFSLFN